MKKSLIALAVLAASGASFAQVTLTGKVGFGYETKSPAGASTVSGIGVKDSRLIASVTEDLGGGTKITASTGFNSGASGRGEAVKARDTTLVISSGAATFILGSLEADNPLIGIADSGASGYGVDGDVLFGPANLDVAIVSYNLGSGLTLDGVYWDDVIGLGKGANSGSPAVAAGLTYAAGPLTAKVFLTSWTRSEGTGYLKDRQSVMGAYDLGVARISAGFSNIKFDGSTIKETLVGVKVPAGQLTFGLDYAIQDKEAANSDVTGFSLGAQYDLSKRTNVNASYQSFKTDGGSDSTATRVILTHNF